jgi:HPt (histidine-containing phosphotransfer) domain-containing protein
LRRRLLVQGSLRSRRFVFLEETPKLMNRLHQAVAIGDASSIERVAHSLKGQLGYFDAHAADAARKLEEMGREGRLEHAAGWPRSRAKLRDS